MKISIVTPSFNQLAYLKRCVASVEDQQGVEIEHIVIDGGSTDGTVDWLSRRIAQRPARGNCQLTFVSEADEGMYDALNKGFDRASGDIFAWLNCDEQYLPGVLQIALKEFSADDGLSILFGGMLMIDQDGVLLACRKALPMRRLFLEASYLYNFSCAMFFSRSVWFGVGGFNPAYRAAGDAEFVLRVLACGYKTSFSKNVYSVFTCSDSNLSAEDSAAEEHRLIQPLARTWVRRLQIPLNILRLAEKTLRGGYSFPAITYAVFVEDLRTRKSFEKVKTAPWWPGHRKPYFNKHRNDCE